MMNCQPELLWVIFKWPSLRASIVGVCIHSDNPTHYHLYVFVVFFSLNNPSQKWSKWEDSNFFNGGDWGMIKKFVRHVRRAFEIWVG